MSNNIHAQILIVEDGKDHAEVMAEALRRVGHVCTVVGGLELARRELELGTFDVIVTDLVMEDEKSGLKVLDLAKQQQPDAETIMVTAHGDVPTAKAALQGGAYDFIEKPLDLDVFRNLVNRAAETVHLRYQNVDLQGQVDGAYGFEGIVGDSNGIREVIRKIRQVSPSTIPILIQGESGTGKELVAAAIHNQSNRKEKKYVTFNCAGQSETLLEDQLFGHVRGAFTGADRDREGVFEYADEGTLFLDEIGDMPLTMQAKLLRVLESGEVVRLGENHSRKVNVRFIGATNKNLREMVNEGLFREDLYFRIAGAEVELPPLRDRRDDIPLLLRHALGIFLAGQERPPIRIDENAILKLVSYPWPGNVRELFNVVQRIIVMLAPDINVITTEQIPQAIRFSQSVDSPKNVKSLAGVDLGQLEKEAIRQTLAMTSGNREQTAKILGIGERTLYRKLKEYGLK